MVRVKISAYQSLISFLILLLTYASVNFFIFILQTLLADDYQGNSEIEQSNLALRVVINSYLSPVATFFFVMAYLKSYSDKYQIEDLKKLLGLCRIHFRLAFLSWLSGFLCIKLFFLIGMIFFGEYREKGIEISDVLNEAFLLLQILFILSAVTVIPFVEEMVFRGVIYAGLANSFGKILAFCLTTILFLFIHTQTIYSDNYLAISALITSSVILLLVRIFMNNLYVAMLIHSGLNAGIAINLF